MRVFGVVVLDGDPIEFGPKVALGGGHQLAREGEKIVHACRVLRRHDEPEMVPVPG